MTFLNLNDSILTLDAAQSLLRQCVCQERSPQWTLPAYTQLRAALHLVAQHSDYQILGICADNSAQAQTALVTYLAALGTQETPTVDTIDGPVYVKFNPNRGRCYVEPYTGVHRGVLVSCQSAYDGDVNETFGHLPLDLFQPDS